MSTKVQKYDERLPFYFENNRKLTIVVNKLCSEIRKSDLSNIDATNLMFILLSEIKGDKGKQKNNKIIRQRTHWIYVSIIIVLVGVILFFAIPNIINWLKYTIGIIVPLGGLWGLLNFILNLCDKFNKNKCTGKNASR